MYKRNNINYHFNDNSSYLLPLYIKYKLRAILTRYTYIKCEIKYTYNILQFIQEIARMLI